MDVTVAVFPVLVMADLDFIHKCDTYETITICLIGHGKFVYAVYQRTPRVYFPQKLTVRALDMKSESMFGGVCTNHEPLCPLVDLDWKRTTSPRSIDLLIRV